MMRHHSNQTPSLNGNEYLNQNALQNKQTNIENKTNKKKN